MRTPRKLCGWVIGGWAAGLALVVPETALADAPPTQPGVVTVTGVTGTSAELSWGNSVDDVRVVGYRVYRGPAAAADSALRLIATTDAVPSHSAARLFSGTAYKFGIVAIDAANNASPMRTVAVTTAASSDTSAPTPPSNGSVTARAFSSSRIDVTWGLSTATDVGAYQVIRDGKLLATVELPSGLRWSDNGLGAGTAHTYVVKAVDAAGNVSAGTAGRKASTLAAGTAQIARGPYLSNVTGTSAVVSWWTNIPTPGLASWGLASANERSAADPAGSVLHHSVTIDGLTPGTGYLYQVGDGAGRASAASSFRSAAAPGQAFTFAAIGDYGGGGPGASQNAANIAAAGTSFILTVGDNVYPSAGNPDPDFATTLSDHDVRLYRPFALALATQAFFPANGNKEYYGDGAFWANFPMPGSNHSWYGYDWGDAHILVLDTEQPFALGTEQYAFAQADLAAHQSAAFRVVVVHVPPYSSTSATSSSPRVQQQLVPLFQQQRVSLVLSGNSHNYERSQPLIDSASASGGITYVVTGAGGNSFNQFTIPAPAWSAFREDTYYEYLRIGVTPAAMQIDAVRADTNTVFDSATIMAPPPPRDVRKPGLRVAIKGRRSLLARRRLRVVVRTDELATVTAAGRLRRIGAFRRARRTVPPEARRELKVRLGVGKARALRRAMRRRGRARAVVTVRARDAAGNQTVVRRRLKIRRRQLSCRQPRVCGRAPHSSSHAAPASGSPTQPSPRKDS
jgi:Iron/zinc purple acid phosphatase-like protein C/Purple acid Phosphatase, N-terminal domain